MEKEMTVKELAALGGAARWEGKSAEDKSAHGRLMVAKRWKGHIAKRPSKKSTSTGAELESPTAELE